jgi:hypothetical protein
MLFLFLLYRSAESLPLVKRAITEVWPKRYADTGGDEPFFERRSFVVSLIPEKASYDYDFLIDTIKNPSLPAGYRAFLLIALRHGPFGAPFGFAVELEPSVREFFKQDLPQRIKDSLNRMLEFAEWAKQQYPATNASK